MVNGVCGTIVTFTTTFKSTNFRERIRVVNSVNK